MKSLKIFLLLISFVALQDCTNESLKVNGRKSLASGKISYAERFTLGKKDGLTELTILNPWQGARNISQVYYLAGKGDKIPQGVDSSAVIRTPVHRVIAMSTTYLSMISALGETDKLIGISGLSLLYDEHLRDAVKGGKIADVGYDDNLNIEMLIRLKPDLVMVYGVGGESSGIVGKLKDLGIKVLINADYLENDPLGKTEWIKVFGALFSREKEADSLFSAIAFQYDSIKKAVNISSVRKPVVMLGLPWKDTWYVSPGNSFMGRLISDAGGDYIWKETNSETSLPYGLENVWLKAMKAEYWLNISTVSTREEILTVDGRLGDLPSFKSGNLYNNNNRVSENGGIDYWESGTMNPQIILRDIAAILHPQLFPGYKYYYYRKVK
jgi:iron complex transport system substrate-binding protein